MFESRWRLLLDIYCLPDSLFLHIILTEYGRDTVIDLAIVLDIIDVLVFISVFFQPTVRNHSVLNILRQIISNFRYLISFSLNLFGTNTIRPNTFLYWVIFFSSHWKPCYHLNFTKPYHLHDKLKGGKCFGSHSSHSLHLGRKDSTSPSRGITPSKCEQKLVTVKTQKR